MNDRDVILMTIYIVHISSFFLVCHRHYLYIFFVVFLSFNSSGICSCNVVYTYRGPLGRI